MDKMIGTKNRNCPHGKTCACNPATHAERVQVKRKSKRRERQAWKKEARGE